MSRKRKGSNINAKGRSKYDASQFTMLTHRMLQSPQFRGLNGNEVRVLLEICTRHSGFNNGRIGVGMTDLSKTLSMSKSTVSDALTGLQGFGFIKCLKKGQFMGRRASEWEVTFLPSEGLKPSNDWAQKKARKQKRKKPPKSFLEELQNCPEMKKQQEQKIEEWYQDQT